MRATLLATLALGWACAGTPARPGQPALSTGTAEALLEADRAFGRDTAQRGLAGWVSWFAEDAAVFPKRGAIAEGLADIKAVYARTGFKPDGLTWSPTRAFLSTSGELGYTYGLWELKAVGADGKSVQAHGKYLTIWRRQRGGAWKVVADIGDEDAPDAAGPQ